MDLVQEMLNVDKKDKPRINMEGIKNHPWYTNEDIPSQQELQQDFDERTKNANANMLEEKKRKESGNRKESGPENHISLQRKDRRRKLLRNRRR